MKKAILVLMACLSSAMLFSQTQTHWSPVSSGTSGSMVLIGKIQINGVDQTSDQLELGVFCGDECRGACIAHLFDYIQPAYYMVDPMVYGDAGNSYTFKLYDHSQNQELDLTSPEAITFNENGYGNVFTPYVLNFTGDVTQTYNLPITGYGTSAGGYYLIAPPIDNVDPATIAGMTTGDFDLYYFDQGETEQWRNYKANAFNLESGKGYLYAHSTDVTLSFTGVPYSGNGQVTLSKTEGAQFAGWNLVGNPFAQIATIDRDCYVMKADGTEIIASNVRTVNPMQGVFVIAASDNETMTFVPQSNTDESAKIVLNVSKERANTIDRVVVRFEGNSTLPKFMLNPNNTKIYIMNEGTDYAVVGCGVENATPVSFKARENGTYILSVDIVNLDLDYLHLTDNMTGADVDLLQTPNYTFEAHTTDYTERFNLVYATTTGISEGGNPFAYYVDGEIRMAEMCHGASLQIVDMTGRLVYQGDAKHCVSTQGIPVGVYVLRLIEGEKERTQKIVIQ